MAASNELNFFRLIAFLNQIVPGVVGTFLETLYFGGSSFETYLNNRKHILFHLINSPSSSYACCECQNKPTGSRPIYQSQFDMLFERATGNVSHKNPCICVFQARTNIDRRILDVTLSTCILFNCESVHPTHGQHLETIRSVRNAFVHSSSMTFNSSMFDDLWIRLQGAISGLTSAINPEYGREIQLQIESLKNKQVFGDEEASLLDHWETLKQTVCGIQVSAWLHKNSVLQHQGQTKCASYFI